MNYKENEEEIKSILKVTSKLNNDIYNIQDGIGLPDQINQVTEYLKRIDEFNIKTFPDKYKQLIANLKASLKDYTKEFENLKSMRQSTIDKMIAEWQKRYTERDKKNQIEACKEKLAKYGLHFKKLSDFRKWSVKGHPNKGGNADVFKEVSECVNTIFINSKENNEQRN